MPTRARSEYYALLREQVDHLDASIARFDDGVVSKASRIAICLRVLLHDTRSSTSLIAHLGLKEELWLLDTAERFGADNVFPTHTLVHNLIGGEADFVPALLGKYASPCECGRPGCRGLRPTGDGPPKWLTFEPWADRVVLAEPGGQVTFTAWELVKLMANKEGGAHVDSSLPEAYSQLSRRNSLGIRHDVLPGGARTLTYDETVGNEAESPVPATIRQLAFEIRWSLSVRFGFGEPRWQPDYKGRAVIGQQYQRTGSAMAGFGSKVTVVGPDDEPIPPSTGVAWSTTLTFDDSTMIYDPRPLHGPTCKCQRLPRRELSKAQ